MKTLNLYRFLLACFFLLPLSGKAQNLVLNGNFTTQPASQWVSVPPSTTTENNYAETSYGGTAGTNIVAELDAQASLRQINIPVQVGKKYYFSYLRSRRTGNGAASNPQTINVKIYDASNTYINRTDVSSNTTFQWICALDSFVANSNTVTIDMTNVSPNANTLGTVVDKITIAAEEQPVTVNGTICQGNDFSLHLPLQDANTQYSNIQWTGPNGFTANTDVVSFTNVQPAQAGTYTATMILNNGCLIVKAIFVVVVQPNLATLNESICEGETYDFFGRMLSSAGTYDTLIHTLSGCDSFVTLHLNTLPNPIVTLNVGDTIGACAGDMKIIEAYKQGDYNYQWYKNGQPIVGSTKDTLEVGEAGTYYVSVTNSEGCSAQSKNVIMEILPRPNIKINSLEKNDFCAMDTVMLRASGNLEELEYTWEPRNNISPYDIRNHYQDVVAVIPESGYVWVTAYNKYYCSASDSIFVTVYPCCEAVVPTAFTPNGDSKNDLFKPILQVGQKVISLSVYNRYGQIVYESRSPNPKGWDGMFKNVPAQQGVYMWQMKYECSDRKIYQKKGDLTLLR